MVLPKNDGLPDRELPMSAVLPHWTGRRKRAERLAILFAAALIASVFVLVGCASSDVGARGAAGDRAKTRMQNAAQAKPQPQATERLR